MPPPPRSQPQPLPPLPEGESYAAPAPLPPPPHDLSKTDVMPLVEVPPAPHVPYSVPPVANTIPPAASPALRHASAFMRGFRDLFRFLLSNGRDTWNNNERLLAMRARARKDPLPWVIASAGAIVFLLFVASSASTDLNDEVRSRAAAQAANAKHEIMSHVSTLKALPPCRPAAED